MIPKLTGGETELDAQPRRGREQALLRVIPYVLTIIYFVVLTGAAWRLHGRFLTHALDLGYFDQILWSTANGHWFANTLKYPWNFMGDHLSPILAFVAPFYWIWSDVRALLAVQTLALALAGLPIYWLARRMDDWLAPFILLAFYLNPAMHLISLSDFHEIALVTPFVSLAVYALVRRRYPLMMVSLFFALLCKEDIAILTLAFGVYLLFDSRARGWGIAISLFSLAWLALALQIIIPAFREEDGYGSIGARYGYLGTTPVEALRTLATRPGVPLAHLAQWDILLAFGRQLLPTGFTALLGWPLFALSLPVFLYLQLSEEPSLYTLQEWHVAPLLPILFAAAIQGIGYLRGRWRVVAVGAMLVGSLWAFTQYSVLPHARTAQGTPPERAARIEAIIDRLSPEAVVSAQSDIVPHVSQRHEVYVFPSIIAGADDIVLDRQGNTYPVSDRYDEIIAAEVLPRPDFRPHYQTNELIWLHKEEIPDLNSPLAVFKGGIKLLDARLAVGDASGFFETVADGPLTLRPGDRLQISLLWQGFQEVEPPYTAFVQLLDEGSGALIGQHDSPPAAGAIPAYGWSPAGVMRDTHYIMVEETEWTGSGHVTAGLYDPDTGDRLRTVDGDDYVVIADFEFE